MSRKPKIACSLDPELAFLKNVKGVSQVFNRVFRKIFEGLADVDPDRLSAWTALVNGKLEVEVSIRPKEPDSKAKRSRQERSLPKASPPKKEKEKSKEEDKTLLHDLVGKFEKFEPGS